MSFQVSLSSNYGSHNYCDNVSWIQVNTDPFLGNNRPLYARAVVPINILGSNGITPLSNTSFLTGSFSGFQTVAASTVVAGLSTTALSGVSSFVLQPVNGIGALTFPANFTVQTPFQAIQLSAGSAILFNA